MATSSEDRYLLKEYADLKLLIDTHKSNNCQAQRSHRASYRPINAHLPRANSSQFHGTGMSYTTKNHVTKPSLYVLNRTTKPRPFVNGHAPSNQFALKPGWSSHINKFQVRSQQNSRPTPSSTEKPLPKRADKMSLDTFTYQTKNPELRSTSAQTIVWRKLGTIERPQTSTQKMAPGLNTSQKTPAHLLTISTKNQVADKQLAQKKLLAMPTPTSKGTPSSNKSLPFGKTVASRLTGKPETPYAKRRSPAISQFCRPLKSPQLKYKFVRPDPSKPPNASKTPAKVAVGQVRRIRSRYKLVATPKKVSSKAKTPVRTPAKLSARKQGRASKYSWSLNSSQVPKKSSPGTPQNFIKSRYRLRKASATTTPKLVKRVNKYSVNYLQRGSPRVPVSKPQFASGRYFTQETPKNNSVMVVIGGMLYRSTKTKLSRPTEQKTEDRRVSSAGKPNQRVVNVRGERFSMDLNRKVMHRLPAIEQKPSPTQLQASKGPHTFATPKGLTRIDIGGETYIQTSPGVLVRSDTNKLRNLANRSVNRSIYRLRASKGKSQQYCLFYNKFGKCNNKEKGLCRYIHDPEKIAICTRFLRGECTVEKCPFSHQLCRSKMPVCKFFLHGRCKSDSCNYRHVNVNPNADICLDFAKGYCPLEEKCKNWHVSVCPQFAQTGKCDKANKCPLKHKQRAVKRPKPNVVSAMEVETRPSASEDPDAEPTTKRRRLPSFISLECDSDAETPAQEVQKGLDVPLQIKPSFLLFN